MSAEASAIVRSRDSALTIERTLASLRSQTADVEIIIVDSGSSDGTLEIANRLADELIEIPFERFTYGYALNVGAGAAGAPFHFALSSHCAAPRADWVERSLGHYSREDVAATNGYHAFPDGTPMLETFHQTLAHARAHPYWGFSNHASSWRASVWEEHPFDEGLDAAEDREWALRVLGAGWVVAFDPGLVVDMSHAWRGGPRNSYERMLRCARAIGSFTPVPTYGPRQLVREWWSQFPDRRHPAVLYRLDYRRAAGLLGKYAGQRRASRRG